MTTSTSTKPAPKLTKGSEPDPPNLLDLIYCAVLVGLVQARPHHAADPGTVRSAWRWAIESIRQREEAIEELKTALAKK